MAVNWDLLKAHYLRGDCRRHGKAKRASQLGSLSLNLMRLHVLANQGSDDAIAHHLVRESQFFVEWTIPTIDLETEISSATELLELQRSLSRWKLNWVELWASEAERQRVATTAQEWCDRLQRQSEALVG
ncbi:MAG: hypothetical protein AAGD25_10960 [Cyanobacteria bacterium P01_F01_bin.150]